MNEHERVGPPTVEVRAREIKPYHYALWCRIEDGKPFANDICGVRWSEDGKKLWFMLESHNFFDAEPDEMVEVVEMKGKHCEYLRAKYADWVLPDPPSKPTYEELAAKLASVESTLKLMRTSHEQTRAEDARAAEARIDALVREVERLRAERENAEYDLDAARQDLMATKRRAESAEYDLDAARQDLMATKRRAESAEAALAAELPAARREDLDSLNGIVERITAERDAALELLRESIQGPDSLRRRILAFLEK